MRPSSGTGTVFCFTFPVFSTGAEAESRKNFVPAANRAAKMMKTPSPNQNLCRMYSAQNHFMFFFFRILYGICCHDPSSEA